MKLIKIFSIQQTIILSITLILAVSVLVTVFSVYTIVTGTSKELVDDQATEINKQIVLNYENYTNRVTGITNLLEKNILDYDIDRDNQEILDLFTSLEEIEGSVSAISLLDNSGVDLIGTRRVDLSSNEIGLKDWYINALFDENIIHFSSPHLQDIYGLPNEEVISASKAIAYKQGGYEKKGILLIDINFQGLDDLSSITNLGEFGHILILDDEDNIVYSSDRNTYGYESESYEIVKEIIFGRTNKTINKTSMAININTISSTRWRIATFQNINPIEEGLNSALITVIILVILTMLITLLVSTYVSSKITDPLKTLDRAIIKFQKGVYNSKVEVQGQKEVRIVTIGFNAMIDKIHELMDEVVVEQEGKRQSEITVLQNQINPHFLYNTLDCMIWLAEENRNEDLVNTVNALSTFFRVSLSKGKQFIPISEELKHIESYMIIQRMRYNDRFEYKINCQPKVSEMKIMKLLLQPLVENAIYHGIDKDDEDSYIQIDVKEDHEYLTLSVTNSGYGISDEKIRQIHKDILEGNEKGSVGMQNVYQRIKLFYGKDAKLLIESELDVNTVFSIRIPLNHLNQ